MNILITGAKGFVGRNLVENLKAIRDGRNRATGLSVGEILEYDLDTDPALLPLWCEKADFVFHLAGVNRPEDPADFMKGNHGFTAALLDTLKQSGNRCPVMISGSVQASLTGRYEGSLYGQSKLAGERLLFDYSRETGAPVLVYRLPNLFGKWCRPNYNSAVATFCHNIARDLPITVSDPGVELELLYIDDLIRELLEALAGRPHRCQWHDGQALACADGPYCMAPVTHRVTLGEIAALLRSFRDQERTLLLPEIPVGSFAWKLYSAYLSYLPETAVSVPLAGQTDERGSFTEILKTRSAGQFSVNVSRPGITKGQHWHNSKWELFVVVAGEALIRQRQLGTDRVLEFRVSGERLEAVHMLPGYTHSIENLSDSRDLVTLMWANEVFDPESPDTYFEVV